MCGFAAIVHLDGTPADPAAVARMRDTMTYRGPDDAGLYVDGPVGLGHRRLSILDLSPAGHQPMPNEDDTVWVVFNGEIYNYQELAAELRARGHRFRSGSDTEVIVHLYEEVGERCVERMNGMFAFVLWDVRRRRLFGARDRVGIKPFHYHLGPDRFVCASEIKAIAADPAVPRAHDPAFFADYLYAGSGLAGRTPLAAVRQLPPGHSLTLADGRLHVRPYWDVAYPYDRGRSDADTVAQLRWLLDDAVRIHCRSDAPLGCHLSGGLDSSTVTALAARHHAPLKAFSIRFDGGPSYDETAYARALARHAGVEYVEDTPGHDDLERLFSALLWHLEVPMPTSGGFTYFTASRLAARHVKVTLTGHGGDELFAGYPAQFQAAFGTTAMFLPSGDGQAEPPPSPTARIRALLRRDGPRGVLRALARRVAPRTPALEETWETLHCGAPPRRHPLLSRGFVRSLGGYTPAADYLRPLAQAPTDEPLDRCLYHDLRSYLPALLLMEDRVSMSVSLESRVPLLDHRVIEFLATVPPEQKVRGLVPKSLLRQAAGSLLPPEVRDRRSKGSFAVPLSGWLRSELASFVRDVVLSPRCLDRGVLDADALRGGRLNPGLVCAALNVELWFRLFVDRDPPPCAEGLRAPSPLASVVAARPSRTAAA